jgi:hypothetical protein
MKLLQYVEHERKTFRRTQERSFFKTVQSFMLKLWSGGERERSRKCSTARNGNILEDAYRFCCRLIWLLPRPRTSVSPDRQILSVIQREGRVRVKEAIHFHTHQDWGRVLKQIRRQQKCIPMYSL